jgi:hypothetical protein
MGLKDGYGVLLGKLTAYHRDDPNDFGRYMHGILTVTTPGGDYTCAVDVDTRSGQIPIDWRIQPLRVSEWAPIFALADGWHPLASNPSSSAVDYIRDPRLLDLRYIPDYIAGPGTVPPEDPFWRELPHRRVIPGMSTSVAVQGQPVHLTDRRAPVAKPHKPESSRLHVMSSFGHLVVERPPWNAGSSDQALTDLESVINAGERIIVFGAPFHQQGRGVHDIHQNQGDPIGGGHDGENAIWQDGITVSMRADGTASAFMNKFSTQSDYTDDQGHPISV